ncbi:protocadherin Fat 1-like [Dreissena polymorpha]|uniref:protocadherin Fat 1-like n=1 Tax=Dreissena polymorpha TaxID=45954 RepID=UPI0022655506|nr:protocadherin Fat 1-like [Dreissena polymorpha]
MNIIIIVCSWVLFASQVECNIPIFTHPSGGDQTTPPCAENMPVSTSVDSVTLADTTGFNVAIHSQTPPFPPFQMTFADIKWNLITPASVTIDREKTQNFTFVFIGTDGSADPRNTVLSIPLTLIIEDENDNFPQFLNDSYARIIYDSVIPEFVLLTIQASDADASPKITYSITAGDDDNTYFIDPNTGNLTVTTPGNLNPVTIPSYNLSVQANDSRNVNTTFVTIHVLDDPCVPTPCANKGTCCRNHTNYTFTCAVGWLGDTCNKSTVDLILNPCISNPCANGGTCVVIGKSFKCICASGIQVPNCSITDPTTISSTKSQGDPCSSKPCQNGGTCSVAGTSFDCR